MSRDSREIFIGGGAIIVLAFILAFLYAGKEIRGTAAAGGYIVNAAFNRVDGLLPGAEVRLGGIPVGRVEAQSLDGYYRAQVRLFVDAGVKLPLDTSAAINTDGLFGAKYIVLEPGGDEQYLKAGGRIEFTQDALIVSQLLDLIIAKGRARMKAARKPPKARK